MPRLLPLSYGRIGTRYAPSVLARGRVVLSCGRIVGATLAKLLRLKPSTSNQKIGICGCRYHRFVPDCLFIPDIVPGNLARQSRNQSGSAARYQLSAISGQLFNKGSEHALHFGGLLVKVVMERCIEQS